METQSPLWVRPMAVVPKQRALKPTLPGSLLTSGPQGRRGSPHTLGHLLPLSLTPPCPNSHTGTSISSTAPVMLNHLELQDSASLKDVVLPLGPPCFEKIPLPPTQGVAPSNTVISQQSFLGNSPLKELGVSKEDGERLFKN